MKKITLLVLIYVGIACKAVYPQEMHSERPVSYVNPFIGTANTRVFTEWGSNGGTYPGAVFPFGAIQVTPETHLTEPLGYSYSDSVIYFFSCTQHFSGYPNGSTGTICIMPVSNPAHFIFRESGRTFSHELETAIPGYYAVQFPDNNTKVEATVTERCGYIKITFPPHVPPHVFVGDMGHISFRSDKMLEGTEQNSLVVFNQKIIQSKSVEGGYIISFAPARKKPTTITLQLSTSTINHESSLNNLRKEVSNTTFEQLKTRATTQWNQELSVIEIEDANTQNKTIFYTALYHSLLMPWVISDVDGNYRGADGEVYATREKKEYGGFSPWDTFRSLHPLLTLIAPERQQDMVLSMLDVYKQTGFLPIEPMTGNHAVPIIVDSYLKGLTGFDSSLAYKAMQSSIVHPPFLQDDLETYHKEGYVPATYAESVTRTVEYAYNDWALSQFARQIMHRTDDYAPLDQRSYAYRNLFDVGQLFLLPRHGDSFNTRPGNKGYKEGNKWIYSYFVPHHVKDLINIMGGNAYFTSRLDSALTHRQIVFDNETVFHIPYLFNDAQSPQTTQKWVRNIMSTRFNDTPAGLPGNDDLGSMSSWYVFSALGFYPTCPGRPVYDIGSPIFKKATVHLHNGKQFTITSANTSGENIYVNKVKLLSGEEITSSQLAHASILKGGGINFEMSNSPQSMPKQQMPEANEVGQAPEFKIRAYAFSKNKVHPDEIFWVKYTLENLGEMGTKIMRLYINGQLYAQKNTMVDAHTVAIDSIPCKTYPVGKLILHIDNELPKEIEVVPSQLKNRDTFKLTSIYLNQVAKAGVPISYAFTIKNVGGFPATTTVSAYINQQVVKQTEVTLKPGEQKHITDSVLVNEVGLHKFRLNDRSFNLKVFKKSKESTVLDLSIQKIEHGRRFEDKSGLNNQGEWVCQEETPIHKQGALPMFDENCYVELTKTEGFESIHQSLTMMAWVYPTPDNKNIVDIIAQGDFNVIQTTNNQSIKFFAGGWGRGECAAALPKDWLNHWHHIAGVCAGNTLKLYIDGKRMGVETVQEVPTLQNHVKWCVGRNEEFPTERIYHGYIDKVKIMEEALSSNEIQQIVNEESKLLINLKKQ